MLTEAGRFLNHAPQAFRRKREAVLQPDVLSARNPAAWYKGRLLSPSPENGIHAVFNGPLIRVGEDTFYHFPRVMSQPQIPGTADRTAYFGVYQILSEHTVVVPHDPLTIPAITGGQTVLHEYGIEDIRATDMGNGTFVCAATAEKEGKPYPMKFTLVQTDNVWQVQDAELMKGVGMGKNTLLLTPDTALHRLETDDDRLVVIKKNHTTQEWDIVDSITFPYITDYNEHAKSNGGGKKRVGLTGATRILMPNGNFRWIMHEVTNTANSYDSSDSVSTYQFRLAEFRMDEQGIPKFVAADPQPLLTYDDMIALAGPGQEPDPKKRVIYSVGGDFSGDVFFMPVTAYDREEHLLAIPREQLQKPFVAGELVTTS